ncbi:MAG: rhomboid family intramembrane serine protease [Burkholderiales bacterium]|nr:rhomboid family intramembrane serine protease [Burkholderiales bacterium]
MFVRAEFLAGAWWQLLTAQWVHVSWLHAAVNLVGLGVLLITFNGWVAKRVLAVALLGGYVGVAVVLALDAGCAWYAGASGALHGLLAGAALALVLDAPRCQGRAPALSGLVVVGRSGPQAAVAAWFG